MRDLALFALLAAFLVAIPKRPYVGLMAWVIFSVMNPHRLSWGAAYDFPFAQLIAAATILSLVFNREPKQLKGGIPGAILFAFFLWLCLTTLFAFEADRASDYLTRVAKTFLMTGVMLLGLRTRRHVELIIWSLVISLGFYGVKGGLFTLATGGAFHVNGPPGSVMEGNNALGVGLVVVIPLIVLLYQETKNRWVRYGLMGGAMLCSVAVLGTYSRGALLAIGGMGLLLWWRSAHKGVIAIAAIGFVLLAIPAMPEQWTERMNTIETYDEDASAMGRIVAWETAYNIAKDRFPVAGGFEYHSPDTSAKYSPVPSMVLVAHSIYFEVLGSQGFIGLLLFISLWLAVWAQCSRIRSMSKHVHELQWAFSTASLLQASLAGYLVGGAFLNLAFWDLPYYLFAISAITSHVVRAHVTATKRDAAAKGNTPTTKGLPGAAVRMK